MSYTYATRKRNDDSAPKKETAPAQPSMDALRSGASQPTQEQMGHRVDLPDAMRAKMENAFGADLGAVKLYESQAVADAGAKAVTRGSDIAFAPGMLDFTSYGGQALLGHELSHVVSQARGEVTGGGFLNDRALEARADREGAMAASGRTVAMPTAAMSGITAAAAAGPMQAKDKDKSKGKAPEEDIQISAPTGGRKMDSKKSSGSSELLKNLGGVAKGGKATIAPERGIRDAVGSGADAAKSFLPAEEAEGGDEDNVFETMLGAADTGTEYMSKANDPLGDITEAGDKVKRIFMGPEKKSSDEHVSKDALLKAHVDAVEAPTALDRISQVGDVGNQAVSTLNGYTDVAKSFAAYDEADKTGSHNARVNAAVDTGDALLNAASGTSDLVAKSAGTLVDAKHATALAKSKELGVKMTPKKMEEMGLNADTMAKTQKAQGVVDRANQASAIIGVGSGALKTGKEIYNAYDAHRTKEAMAASMAEMDKRQGPRTEAEEEMYRTFNQGRRNNAIQQTSHTYKAVASALGTAGSAASLAGAGPVAETLLGAASTGVEKWGEMVTDYETDKFHTDTVNEATGIEAKMAAFRNDPRFKNMKISDKDLRRALLRQMGASSGEDDEMFQSVTQKRAKTVVDQARAGNQDALNYMGNARIDVDAEKADEGVEHSLGLEERKEYHDASALKYDEFEENAKKNQKWKEDTALMTNGQKAGYFLRQQGQALGQKFRTGGKQVAEGAKSALSGFKKMGGKALGGLRKAGLGAINFMVDPNTRADALQSLKTGASKAAQGIGNGFKNAGTGLRNAGTNMHKFMTDAESRKASMAKAREALKYPGKVIGHAISKKADAVSDWYTKGVDQLNLNRQSYENMNAFDRAKWTMKNLPARIMAGTQKGRESTVKRYNRMINSDDATKAFMGAPAPEAPAPEAPVTEDPKKKKALAGA